jgi:hypothetical protein
MTAPAAARMAAALAVALPLAMTSCDGHLDFGARAGAGGSPGGPTCASEADCRLSVLHCDLTGTKTCVACIGDAECGTTAGAPRCDPVLRRCVACVAATDCAATQTCVAGHCLATCQDDTTAACPATLSCHSGVCGSCGDDGATACASLPATPFCLPSAGTCVGCRTDLDCSAAMPRCDPVTKRCVQCASGADCPVAAPLCDPRTGTCSAG